MYPDFLPAAVSGLTEATSIQFAQHIRRQPVSTPVSPEPLATPYVSGGESGPPLVLLHGFDSSLLEFRRLFPRLSHAYQTWAFDVLGFGFSDRPAITAFDPNAIKAHLHCAWQQLVKQPMVLVGASMGGAVAIDFALTYPEAVAALVLIDSAGFAAGPPMDKVMFPPLDRWATAFLRNPGVRRRTSQSAYRDRRLVTADAELCASLHLQCPRWQESLIAFAKSGGYTSLAAEVSQLPGPALVVWGDCDRILGTADAQKFVQAIPHSQLTWIEDCGHVPHLEKPADTAEAILSFVQHLELNKGAEQRP